MTTTTINAGTSTSGVSMTSGNDGTLTIQTGTTAGSQVTALSIDAAGHVAMPQSLVTFSAYQSSAQSVPTATLTKMQIQTKEFDVGSYFDNTTNYRFTPLVPGYYKISGAVYFSNNAATVVCSIFKNGSDFKRGSMSGQIASAGQGSSVSALVYFNGTTDYVELYGQQSSGSSLNTIAGTQYVYFQGILIAKA